MRENVRQRQETYDRQINAEDERETKREKEPAGKFRVRGFWIVLYPRGSGGVGLAGNGAVLIAFLPEAPWKTTLSSTLRNPFSG